MNECTPEPGRGRKEIMQSKQVGVGRPLEFRVLASGGAGGPTWRTSGSLLAQARFRTHTGSVSHLGSESAPLTPLCFADERDPAGHGLHQAQPLGQEQPVCPPRGPVPRVSRGHGPGLPAAQSTAPPNKMQDTLCLRRWDLSCSIWLWDHGPSLCDSPLPAHSPMPSDGQTARLGASCELSDCPWTPLEDTAIWP